MHEHGLAKELWPQLRELAAQRGFVRVERLELVVGMLHGVTAEFLAHSLQHAFQGTSFQGAKVDIAIVEPGGQFTTGDGEPKTVGGWELLVTRMEGQE